jgi:hypothetical protein
MVILKTKSQEGEVLKFSDNKLVLVLAGMFLVMFLIQLKPGKVRSYAP